MSAVRTFNSILLATFTMLLAEYVATVQNEARFMWKGRFGLASVIFFMCRYLPLVNVLFAVYTFVIQPNTDPTLCRNEYIAISVLAYVEFQLCYAVLCLRTYAVWQTKLVFVVLLTAFIGVTTASGYITAKYVQGSFALQMAPGWRGCAILIWTDHIWHSLLLTPIFDSLALTLLIAKSYMTFRSRMLSVKSSLLTIMLKDGIGYFFCVLGVSIANLVFLLRVNIGIRDFFILPQCAIQNALCVRLMLHLHYRGARSDELVGEDDTADSKGSYELKDHRERSRSIQFAQHTMASSTA